MYCKKCDRHWGNWVKNCWKKNGGCGEKLVPSFVTIISVEATEMPDEVLDYCVDCEISTHHQNDIIALENDGNIFAEWLISNGYKFKEDCDYIGIIAT